MKNKKMVISLIGVLSLLLLLVGLTACAQLGSSPSGAELTRIKQSPNYSSEKEMFTNQIPGLQEKMEERMDYWDVFKEMWSPEDGVPKAPLPEMKPNFSEFQRDDPHIKAIWFGHSSVLLRVSDKNILLDPVFSDYASLVPFMVGRFQAPVIEPETLPEIDYIVISHDHYDHLDKNTVQFFKDKNTQFLVPLGVGSHLRGWGIDSGRITEMDWWDEKKIGDIRFIETPAQHFSGRGIFDKNKTLWASWVIDNGEQKIYFSGDSGYGPHFKQIGEKFGPFDAIFMESGQYNYRWAEIHLMPENFVKVYQELKGKRYIPIHWGMFQLSVHPWYEPVKVLSTKPASDRINLVTPKIGQVISLEEEVKEPFSWAPYFVKKENREN